MIALDIVQASEGKVDLNENAIDALEQESL
jgi:hypothetical protein